MIIGHSHSRRKFISMAGTGLVSTAGIGWSGAALADVRDPDFIVHNAKVYRVEPAGATAQAFAVKNGRFVAVGGNDEIKALAGPDTRQVDAGGMTIVPGFIDAHCHPVGTWLLYEVLVGNPFEVEFVSIDSILSKLKAKAEKTPAGFWVEGFFYDDTKVTDKREITADDLDKVSTQHPVVVRHRGGHTAYFNHKALEMAGITKATPNIQGGTYDKLPNGELSGRVTDTAIGNVTRIGQRPTYSPADLAERERAGAAEISKQFVRYGLTSVHHQGGDLAAVQDIRARGELRHRVSYEVQTEMLDAMIANGIKTGFGDEWIKLGATFEHAADGSFSERTMAMSHNYPGTNYKGNVTRTQEQLDEWVGKVHRAGIKVNVHANGDVAIASTLTSYERAQQAFPVKDPRFKITHCTIINDDILRRMKAVGAIPAVFTSYAYYNSDKFVFYGEEMMKRAMAFRSFLDAGIPACAGSDFFPGPFAPLMGMQGMVTRKGWDGKVWGANQRVTVQEALRILSFNGAYANHEDHEKGSINPGMFADFVVLAQDPHTVDPETIKDIKIVRTVTGGNTVYEA